MPSRDENSDGKVYVGDLGSSGSKQELEDAFSYYGPLKNVWVARNPPGFAFVEFEDARDAEDSVRDMDGKTVCGRRIKVEMASGRGKGGSFKEGRGGMSSRYDGSPECKVYVGDLGSYGSKQELEDAFSYYGPLRNVWVAQNPPGFAFVEFEDPRDAEDSVRGLDGRRVCGRRIKVEMATGRRKSGGGGGGRSRGGYGGGYGGGGYGGRAPPRGGRGSDERCYECGERGHFARDCRGGRGSGSYRGGTSGSRRRSYSRSRSRSRSPRSRSPRSRSRSYSRSRSQD